MSLEQQFNVNIFDYSPIPYCVVELIVGEDGQPTDWIYRYCNQAFADVKGYRLDAMKNQSILSLTPRINQNYLQMYYEAAYHDTTCERNVTARSEYHAVVAPIGKHGFCSCTLCQIEQDQEKNQSQENSQSDASKETTKNTQLSERIVVDKLFPEYVSLYHIELNTGNYEILRLNGNTNARQIAGNNPHPFANFDEYTRAYAKAFILEEDKKEFLDWHLCQNMKNRLITDDKMTYHYHSVSKDGNDSYYEAYAVRGKVTENEFHIFLGYRNVDSILYKEKEIQAQLKKALDEAKLSNEIISAIAKTYQYISRIDLEADWFEEISNKNKKQLNFINCGILSENNKKVCRQLVAEEYQDAFFKFTDIHTLPERMKDEQTIMLEYRMKDGNWHKLRFIEKKRDENGKLTHVLCVIRSISDAKKKEQTLLYEVSQAKKESAQKTKFLSNMSHDIRTPMNGIIGMIDLANRYPDDSKVQQKCRDKVLESSKYLVALVNDILDMNKLESGDTVDQTISFDLIKLLKRVNEEKKNQAKEKLVSYFVDWNKSDLTHTNLIGIPVYLERLLAIIADNAVKFTNSGGSIHVWCEEKSFDTRQVIYEFGCSDNGIGMSESFIEHAFDAFSQENESSRSQYEGSGLGLAIAKKLVDNMNGTITIQSKKGSGTTVLTTIPFAVEETENKNVDETEEQTGETIDQISLKGRCALIVEDNELNMEIAKFMLEDNGVLVECANDGAEALEKFENSTPGYYDAIFMDIMMPKLNGWETTKKIRAMARPDAGTIPIIAMSANSFAEDIVNSRICGMNWHLTKPLDEEKLLEAFREGIANRNHRI